MGFIQSDQGSNLTLKLFAQVVREVGESQGTLECFSSDAENDAAHILCRHEYRLGRETASSNYVPSCQNMI